MLQEYHRLERISEFATGPELPTTLKNHTHTKGYLMSTNGYSGLDQLSTMSVKGEPTRSK